ncbi:MAG: hypothetical protein NC340_05545 [Ruminococcus flavefaciens]|nr:hypothetical protein [Ruminococcus flavefaciens]MCM1230508.1 hypothetical protein [Ruminococcus flavefaciens]
MSDKDKRQENTDDDKLHITKNIFEVSREQREKSAEEERLRQAEAERIEAENQRREQEEHDRRLEAERLELIRLKQGVIEESETIHEEQEEEIRRNFFQKIGDFFYSNKWWMGIALVFVIMATVLTVNLINRPRPDVIVLVIGESYAISEESSLDEYVASFADDYNGNGETLVSVYYIPYTGIETKDYANGVDTNLTTELNSAHGVILIGNKLTKNVLFDDSLVDLSEIYPDNQYISKDKFMLSETDFAEKIGLQKSQISDDWFISIRTPKKLLYSDLDEMQETYDKDFAVFDSIIKDLTETE